MHKSLGAATVALPIPAWIICSYDEQNRPNAMAASWTGICNSKPPMAYFSARNTRYTHKCVMRSQAFTINIASARQAELVDYLGMSSGKNTDKFRHTGLKAVPAEHVNAPYIEEFPLVLECEVADSHGLGSHTMFIGVIRDVKCDEAYLDAEGWPDTAAIAPFIYSTSDSTYHAVSGLLGKGYKLGTALLEQD